MTNIDKLKNHLADLLEARERVSLQHLIDNETISKEKKIEMMMQHFSESIDLDEKIKDAREVLSLLCADDEILPQTSEDTWSAIWVTFKNP